MPRVTARRGFKVKDGLAIPGHGGVTNERCETSAMYAS
jgi:hypothetical protein